MNRDTTVVVLAGGKGTRLAPYTTVLPKPLMPVCDQPILQIVLEQLRHHGFRNVVVSVGHLAELIMAFFADGRKWGMNIRYAIEETPLGTIGPLRSIDELGDDFVVMNGDLLTDLDYGAFFDHHRGAGHLATVATATREVQISLGVLEFDAARRMTAFREKPTHTYAVSMGIYAFNRDILATIPPTEKYGFDELMLDMLAAGRPTHVYPHTGLWLDIGRHEDYAAASTIFEQQRERLLPGTASAAASNGTPGRAPAAPR